MLTRLFPSRRQDRPAALLYGALVEQARKPVFYSDFGVPDTLDGRFDLIVLHLFLALHRLKAEGAAGKALARGLTEVFVQDMDQNLREMGVGDLGVSRRVKDMARALFGRIEAYELALAGGNGPLEAALARNLYGAVEPASSSVAAMAGYARQALDSLEGCDLDQLKAGHVRLDLPIQERPNEGIRVDRAGGET